MKKILLIATTMLIVIVGGIYFATHKRSENMQPATQNQADISVWKTYQNTEFGFSIKYPPQYVAKEDVVAIGTPWGSRGLLTISRTDELPQVMLPTFHIVSAQVTLQRQPVVVSGEVYHNIAEYQKSGAAAQMVQGVPNPNGELVTVNGVQALKYYFPSGDVAEVSADSYFFIKDDLIYHVSFSNDDPNGKAMLESIKWQ